MKESLTVFSKMLMAALFCRSREICWNNEKRVLDDSLDRTVNWPWSPTRSEKKESGEVV